MQPIITIKTLTDNFPKFDVGKDSIQDFRKKFRDFYAKYGVELSKFSAELEKYFLDQMSGNTSFAIAIPHSYFYFLCKQEAKNPGERLDDKDIAEYSEQLFTLYNIKKVSTNPSLYQLIVELVANLSCAFRNGDNKPSKEFFRIAEALKSNELLKFKPLVNILRLHTLGDRALEVQLYKFIWPVLKETPHLLKQMFPPKPGSKTLEELCLFKRQKIKSSLAPSSGPKSDDPSPIS